MLYEVITTSNASKHIYENLYNNGFIIESVDPTGDGYTNSYLSIYKYEYHLFKLKEEKPSYQTSKAFLSEESKVEQLENKIKRLEAQVKDQGITIKAFKIVVETLQKVLGEKKEM